MEMEDDLPAIRVHVEHCSVTLLRDAEVLRNLAGCCKHVGQQRFVFCGNVVQGRDVFSRADEDMYRRLRTDVVEGDDAIVLIGHFRWQFFVRDSAEKARLHTRAGFYHASVRAFQLLESGETHNMIANRKFVGLINSAICEQPGLEAPIALPVLGEGGAVEPHIPAFLETRFNL